MLPTIPVFHAFKVQMKVLLLQIKVTPTRIVSLLTATKLTKRCTMKLFKTTSSLKKKSSRRDS